MELIKQPTIQDFRNQLGYSLTDLNSIVTQILADASAEEALILAVGDVLMSCVSIINNSILQNNDEYVIEEE